MCCVCFALIDLIKWKITLSPMNSLQASKCERSEGMVKLMLHFYKKAHDFMSPNDRWRLGKFQSTVTHLCWSLTPAGEVNQLAISINFDWNVSRHQSFLLACQSSGRCSTGDSQECNLQTGISDRRTWTIVVTRWSQIRMTTDRTINLHKN